MKTIAFLILCCLFGRIPGLYAQEDALWAKIRQDQKNEDIIDYVFDYPQGQYIGEIEKLLYKKCVKDQKEKDCQTYIDLFSETGRYLTSVMGILERILDEKEERGEQPEIFELISLDGIIDFLESGAALIGELKNEEKSTSSNKTSTPRSSASIPNRKYYPVILQFSLDTDVSKVQINGKDLSLTKSFKWKQVSVSLSAGKNELKVYKGKDLTCHKLLSVSKPTTITYPCRSLPDFPKK